MERIYNRKSRGSISPSNEVSGFPYPLNFALMKLMAKANWAVFDILVLFSAAVLGVLLAKAALKCFLFVVNF